MPQFEKTSGHKVTTTFTGTIDAQKRIAAGEAFDLVVMAGTAIDDLIKSGKIVPGSRVDLATSGVGVAVRVGAPRPDIHSTEALKKTLLAAKSIGYSSGPSGVYLTGLFSRLGIADQIKPKLKQAATGAGGLAVTMPAGEASGGGRELRRRPAAAPDDASGGGSEVRRRDAGAVDATRAAPSRRRSRTGHIADALVNRARGSRSTGTCSICRVKADRSAAPAGS